MIGINEVIRCFEDGNVCVTGLRGRGKDLLMANVVVRRKKPYIANIDYTEDYIPFVPSEFDCGRNSYKNFIDGNINYYEYPYEDGTDIYISDVGVYFPSQYCSELNRDYKYFPTFLALSRQLGEANVFVNAQNLNRIWDKIREQCDIYITCNKCFYIQGYVIQIVTIYDKYDSCVQRVKPFNIRCPFFSSPQMRQNWEIEKQRYEQHYGVVKRKLLIYKNLSNYDTRKFKEILSNGVK